MLRLLILLLALLPLRAMAQQDTPLVAALSRNAIEITTGFTGGSIVVFGSTDMPIGPGADEVLIVVRGPSDPFVVRRKVKVLGLFWVNGPSARFPRAPGFYAIAGTRPAWQILPEAERQRRGLGLDALPLESSGSRDPRFRAALLDLRRASRLWQEDEDVVEIAGSRLFHLRLPLPASVHTGDYQVEVLLVRSRQVVARQLLNFRVDRVGTADRIATVAQDAPLVYGLLCILLAALAGWLGSVLFRRS